MIPLVAALDRKRRGTHYADRMQRILGVCQDCGLLWHHERVEYRDGAIESKRIDDVEPEGRVLITPRYEKYGMRVSPRMLKRIRGLGGQFAYALNVDRTLVQVEGNIVYVRVPRSDASEELVTFKKALSIAPDLPVGSLLLGIDEDSHQLVTDFCSANSVHAAIIGMTGSGKSSLMRTMALSALLTGGSRVALFDPTGGLGPLSGHPNVWRGGAFEDAVDCEMGLGALARSMRRGDRRLTYVFVDEVPDLVAQRKGIRHHVARLAQAGRHAGIHLVLGAQHPLASELGSTTLRNIAVRLVGRVADRTAAYHAAGRNDTGAETLRGRGDFCVVNGSTIRRFQAALVSDAYLGKWQERYPPRSPRVPHCAAAQASPRPTLRSPSGGPPGRPPDEIPASVVRAICGYIKRTGDKPSSNWVYRMTRRTVPTGGFNRTKAQRAIEAAVESLAS